MSDDLLVCDAASQNPSLSICAGGFNPMVIIHPDGRIEYGEGYTPDAAAKIFWDALGYERKQRAE